MRGQAEFVAIILVVAIVILSVYAGLTYIVPSDQPQAVSLEQQNVKHFVERSLKEAAVKVIKLSEIRGGFLLPEDAVSLQFHPVGYWQKCNNNIAPDKTALETTIGRFIENQMIATLRNISEINGKNVSFATSQAETKVGIFDNKIDVTLTVPTTISGTRFPLTYDVSIPSRYGRIYKFGKDYVEQAVKEPAQNGRPFEAFTYASVLASRTLPTYGILTQCGETKFLTPDDVATGLERVITNTLNNLKWWVPMEDQSGTDTVKWYAIEAVNGKTYPELNISLNLPDNFELEGTTPVFLSNHKLLYTTPLGVFPVCEQYYNVQYSVEYPLIFSVTDDLLDTEFRFATLVSTNSSQPNTDPTCQATGNSQKCSWVPVFKNDGSFTMEWQCFDAPASCSGTCSARIVVQDTDGNPLPGTRAVFGSCGLQADSNGIITGPISCGTESLIIYKQKNYDFIQETKSAAEVNGTYTLAFKPNRTVRFTEITTTKANYTIPSQTSQGKEIINYISCNVLDPHEFIAVKFTSLDGKNEFTLTNIDPVLANQCQQTSACKNCNANNKGACQTCTACYFSNFQDNVSVSYIPEGVYAITAEKREIGQFRIRAVAGDASYPLGKNNHSFYVNMYQNPELTSRISGYTPFLIKSEQNIYTTDNTQNVGNSSILKSLCGINPVTKERPENAVVIEGQANCHRTSIRKFLETYKATGCISQADINAISGTPSTLQQIVNTLLKTKCGIHFRGCQ